MRNNLHGVGWGLFFRKICGAKSFFYVWHQLFVEYGELYSEQCHGQLLYFTVYSVVFSTVQVNELTVPNCDHTVPAPSEGLSRVAWRALEILVVFTTTSKREGTCPMKGAGTQHYTLLFFTVYCTIN